MRAPRADQLALIRAHPDLAGRAAISGELTVDSKREQAGAGLDSLTPEEFARFSDLNSYYRQQNGFPFIFAVKGATKQQILAAFEERVKNNHATEFAIALTQVCRIFHFPHRRAGEGMNAAPSSQPRVLRGASFELSRRSP